VRGAPVVHERGSRVPALAPIDAIHVDEARRQPSMRHSDLRDRRARSRSSALAERAGSRARPPRRRAPQEVAGGRPQQVAVAGGPAAHPGTLRASGSPPVGADALRVDLEGGTTFPRRNAPRWVPSRESSSHAARIAIRRGQQRARVDLPFAHASARRRKASTASGVGGESLHVRPQQVLTERRDDRPGLGQGGTPRSQRPRHSSADGQRHGGGGRPHPAQPSRSRSRGARRARGAPSNACQSAISAE
jgi:hypothetical protein